jgi:glycosyltransferase involved in cell wall biosynthesis
MANFIDPVAQTAPANWTDIAHLLSALKDSVPLPAPLPKDEFFHEIARGVAFITYDYGIDGVSIEIGKYAQALEDLLEDQVALHFIGGNFYPQAESVLKPSWQRFRIAGINGWSKWGGGKWFSALYYEDMPEGSEVSARLAAEIFEQAVSIARQLAAYFSDNDISLLIPVNIASNPGNLALTLALVMVGEGMGLYAINSNHDFYWEGSRPASERAPGEPPGVRDHFFRNVANGPFFALFESLYPWNGRRWLQTNINRLQSEALVREHGFSAGKVFELSTAVSNAFFQDYTQEDVKLARLRMGHILSDGEAILHPIPIGAHLARIGEWMKDQRPCILGAQPGLTLDPTSDDLIYLLQPTRVIARKRIERDWHLVEALLSHPPFRDTFEQNPNQQLVMHITGPTPVEHQTDLERVLHAYVGMLGSAQEDVANRLFLAFSVGNEDHPSFRAKGFARLTIEDIYRMATVIVFPSETEGRGLPIVESSACGVPIICSRYHPEAVFAGVVGEHLPPEQQIRYTLFPDGDFTDDFLDEATDLLLYPGKNRERIEHNKAAVRERYSRRVLRDTFEQYLETLRTLR